MQWEINPYKNYVAMLCSLIIIILKLSTVSFTPNLHTQPMSTATCDRMAHYR